MPAKAGHIKADMLQDLVSLGFPQWPVSAQAVRSKRIALNVLLAAILID